MVCQNVKMEAPSPLNGNTRNQRGPTAEGVALKIIIASQAIWTPLGSPRALIGGKRGDGLNSGTTPTGYGINLVECSSGSRYFEGYHNV